MKVEICIDLQLITVHFDHGNSKQEHVMFGNLPLICTALKHVIKSFSIICCN